MPAHILHGDCRIVLPTLPAQSIQCVVTSPPYYALRDYGVAAQLGLEATPDQYVAKLVDIFGEIKRVLRDDGTCWLNLGDSYSGSGGYYPDSPSNQAGSLASQGAGKAGAKPRGMRGTPKNLLGIPWRVAFALQADGWYLRSDIIWHKPNPKPERVGDRPTSAHEHIFLLSKRPHYYYDQDAIREPVKYTGTIGFGHQFWRRDLKDHSRSRYVADGSKGANARNVWSIGMKPYKGGHYATMPMALAERCILAGSRSGDMILDPFGGAGTTAVAAVKHGRDATLIELNADYIGLAEQRLA